MDKTTRLIKWQRITIAALLLSLCFTSLLAYNYRLARIQDRLASEVFVEGYVQRGEALLVANYYREADEKIIRDLNERLSKEEHKHGEIYPVRRSEGIFIAPDLVVPYLPKPIE